MNSNNILEPIGPEQDRADSVEIHDIKQQYDDDDDDDDIKVYDENVNQFCVPITYLFLF